MSRPSLKRAAKALAEARAHLSEGRPLEALAAATAACRADPRCAYGWFLAAAAAAATGRRKRAEEAFARLSSLASEDVFRYGEFAMPRMAAPPLRRFSSAWAFAMRAFWLRSARRYDEACEAMEKAVKLDPGNAAFRAFLGNACFAGRRPRQGLAHLRRAAALAPRCGWIRAWLGEALRRLGRSSAALEALTEAVALDPRYPQARAWRGAALRARGRAREAERELGLALRGLAATAVPRPGSEADPAPEWVLGERLAARRALGDVPGALEDAARLHELSGRHGWLAGRQRRPEDLSSADRQLTSFLRKRRHAWALAWRGWVRLEAGRAEEAWRDLNVAARLGARRGWVLAWRGRAAMLLGRRDDARYDLERVVRRQPGYAPAWGWLGGLEGEEGRWRLAEERLDRCVALDPSCAWGLAWRAAARLARGRPDGARQDLDRSLAIEPGNAEARALLAGLPRRAR